MVDLSLIYAFALKTTTIWCICGTQSSLSSTEPNMTCFWLHFQVKERLKFQQRALVSLEKDVRLTRYLRFIQTFPRAAHSTALLWSTALRALTQSHGSKIKNWPNSAATSTRVKDGSLQHAPDTNMAAQLYEGLTVEWHHLSFKQCHVRNVIA